MLYGSKDNFGTAGDSSSSEVEGDVSCDDVRAAAAASGPSVVVVVAVIAADALVGGAALGLVVEIESGATDAAAVGLGEAAAAAAVGWSDAGVDDVAVVYDGDEGDEVFHVFASYDGAGGDAG